MTMRLQQRAKYSTAEIMQLGREGKAYKTADGFSFPIGDIADLRRAIRAVGRSSGDHDKVRAFIVKRARALGAMSLVPESWNSDGSLRAWISETSTQPHPVGMELRTATDGSLEFTGYATIFDYDYEVGTFRERFRPGSFKRTLADKPDVTLLINHEGLPLARTSSGTMTLTEDENGLLVEAELDAENPRALELRSLVRRGDVREMSLAFSVLGQDGQHWSDDFEHREILSANMHRGDVSAVTQGANPATTLSMRGHGLSLEQRRRNADALGLRITGARAIPGGIRAQMVESDEGEACPRCEGYGQIVCPDCRGTGVIEDSHLTGAVGTNGLEEPASASSAPDGQRGVVVADLQQCRLEVEALRDSELARRWDREAREGKHQIEMARIRRKLNEYSPNGRRWWDG